MKKLILFTIMISVSVSQAGLGSFAAGYVVGKHNSKKVVKTYYESESTELKELTDKIIGTRLNSGWAFNFSPENMKVEIDLSGYEPNLVRKVVNDLLNNHYPVSLKKNNQLVFDWKKEYCDNYTSVTQLKFHSLLKRVSDISRTQAYNYTNCPFLSKELSKNQRYELLGDKFEEGHYLIGGGSWVGYEHIYEHWKNSYQKIEETTTQIKLVAEKYCPMSFKDTKSKILGSILKMKEEYLYDTNQKIKVKDLEFSYDRLCSKQNKNS